MKIFKFTLYLIIILFFISSKSHSQEPFIITSESLEIIPNKHLSFLEGFDETISFDSQNELENLIKTIKPDILVVGSDWEGKYVVGSQYAKELKFFQRIGEYSTTRILQNDNLR